MIEYQLVYFLLVILIWVIFSFSKDRKQPVLKHVTFWEPFYGFLLVYFTLFDPVNVFKPIMFLSQIKRDLQIEQTSMYNNFILLAWFIVKLIGCRLLWLGLQIAYKSQERVNIAKWKYYVVLAFVLDFWIFLHIRFLNEQGHILVLIWGLLIALAFVLTTLVLFNKYETNKLPLEYDDCS